MLTIISIREMVGDPFLHAKLTDAVVSATPENDAAYQYLSDHADNLLSPVNFESCSRALYEPMDELTDLCLPWQRWCDTDIFFRTGGRFHGMNLCRFRDPKLELGWRAVMLNDDSALVGGGTTSRFARSDNAPLFDVKKNHPFRCGATYEVHS